MPSWRGHLFFAGFMCVIAAYMIKANYGEATLIAGLIYLPLYFVGSLLPDLDHPISKIRKWFFIITLLLSSTLILIGYYTNTWWYAIYALFGIWLLLTLYATKHRGLLHTLYFTGLLGLVLHMSLGIAGDFILAGYLSHILADGAFKN